MTTPQQAAEAQHRRRGQSVLPAFLLGIPLAVGFLVFVYYGPLQHTEAARYFQHEVECVEVIMFCCALGALADKLWKTLAERAALRTDVLPAWDGKPHALEEAGKLLAGLRNVPRRRQDTYLMGRVRAALEFLHSRGSADQLDDQLRTLADNDALTLENSNALLRFITWAIPILGFLGTVLGITKAIANVSPEQLEHDLQSVTHGLALAFDATALALGLTMVTMFLTYLVDRSEQGILAAVDDYADRQLAHRFERTGTEEREVAGLIRQQSQHLLKTNEQLVRRQAEIWAETLKDGEHQRLEAEQQQQTRFVAALETAVERTLKSHQERLVGMEKQSLAQADELLKHLTALTTAIRDTGAEQQAALRGLNDKIAAQAKAIAHLQDSEKQLRRLQELLNQNLAALASTGTFEQAMSSLTAAIHLFTARTGTGIASSPKVAA